MLSLGTFARSAPRALSRVTASSLRQPAMARASTWAMKASVASALRPARAAAFSTTGIRRAAAGETDDQLLAKMESEIEIEDDLKANGQQPASVKDFLENSPFELIDEPGMEVVKLVRSFGDEKITVSFSIMDMADYDPYAQDSALDDEDLDDEAIHDPNHQGASSSGGARSSAAEEQLDEDGDEDIDEPSAPINVSVVVEKPGKSPGALNVEATVHDGSLVVDNVSYFDDAKVIRRESPEAVQKRADMYLGPPFATLDEDLQVLMERFLEERGITQALALFIPDYVDVKEQAEYRRWLNKVKSFVEA